MWRNLPRPFYLYAEHGPGGVAERFYLVCEKCYDEGNSGHDITECFTKDRTAFPNMDRVCFLCAEFV
jgi:hypothetical protein